jgi:hypothetical protein
MFKTVKIAVLLVVVVCAVIGIYAYVRASRDLGGGGPEEIGDPAVRVEEKYGFTSETAEP